MELTKDLIKKLKIVKEERNLSYNDILRLVQENGGYVSKTSIVRVFSEESEDKSFMQETLLPIANALLESDENKEDDDAEKQAKKALHKVYKERIEELQNMMNEMEIRHLKELEKERQQSRNSIEFLKEQITLKDKRMDQFIEAIFKKDRAYNELLQQYLSCPYSRIGKENSNVNCQKGKFISDSTDG